MARVNIRKDLRGVRTKADRMIQMGQYALANQAHADMNRYVPYLTGNLRNQSFVASGNKSVIWNTPYARRQFYNYGAKFTTPGTGPRWDLKAKSIHGTSWARVAKAAMK